MWVWNASRRELVKKRQDGRPASPSASSSTSRRHSAASTPAGASTTHHRREEVIIRRATEATFGRVDPDDWVSNPSEPVDWDACLTVAIHLTPEKHLSYLLISIIKLPLVQTLMKNLVEYFGVLFNLCDEIRKIEAPSIVNEELLKKRWDQRLIQVLNPLSATYTRLLMGQELGNEHHMKQGRSLHSSRERDEQIWNGIYDISGLLVWLIFRRRDKFFIQTEMNRLFRGSNVFMNEDLDLDIITKPPVKAKKPSRKDVLSVKSGLEKREVPDLKISRLIHDSFETMSSLTHVRRKDGSQVWGHGLGLLGARKLDLNEVLEPAVAEESDEDEPDI